MHIRQLIAAAILATSTAAQQPAQSALQPSPASELTIYNENFAVARSTIDLDLHPGLNEISTNQVTTQLEPDSVVLRDLAPGVASANPHFASLSRITTLPSSPRSGSSRNSKAKPSNSGS
ncbi:MAG: hypothetical protein WDM87_05400 [Terracidiphilus sp.]